VDVNALLCHVLACQPSYLFTWPDKNLTDSQWQTFQQLLAKREQGVPVAHLTGSRGFWSLDLAVNESTLIPRADTELLVSIALTKIKPDMRVIDLGTGTGAIILSLAVEHPEMHFFATDLVFDAVGLAKYNANRHQLSNVSFVQAQWLTPFKPQQFDMVVSNPPYIRELDEHLESGDVRFEPRTALTSGDDGLADIRQIIEQAKQHLREDGWLLLEHGYDQGQQVMDLMNMAGFENIELFQDYGGNDRAVIGQLTL
jgi:release factor glutamine methyltransferase